MLRKQKCAVFIYIYIHIKKTYRRYNEPLEEIWWVSEPVRLDSGSAQTAPRSVSAEGDGGCGNLDRAMTS